MSIAIGTGVSPVFGGRAAGVPGLTLTLGPLRNDGTADLTVISVPADADALRWRIDAADTPEIFAEAEADVILGPGVTATASTDGTTVTITVTAPPAYAGGSPYTVTEAALLAGPVNLVPPSVSESGGTYTATPGLWVTLANDPALFTYEWRSGSTVWTTGDGVAAGALSFTPDTEAQAAISLSGLDFREIAQNDADTVYEEIEADAPNQVVAIRYNPSRNGGVYSIPRITSTVRKLSVLMRFNLAGTPSLSGDQMFLCGQANGFSRARITNGDPRLEIIARTAVGGVWQTISFTAAEVPTGQWRSLWFTFDFDAGLSGGVRGVARMNDTTKTVTGTSPSGQIALFDSIGSANTAGGGFIFNGDFAAFAAFWIGEAPDPRDNALWDEVFDSTNGHAIRSEYISGTKNTIGGTVPTAVFAGANMLNGVNTGLNTYTWGQSGVLQEAIYG